MNSDDVNFGIETVAAFFCGPMAVITIYAILTNKPWRHAVQPVVATAQAYGVGMTWFPELFLGMPHVPDDFVMKWVYFWGTQAPWVIVPLILVIHSIIEVSKYKVAPVKSHVE